MGRAIDNGRFLLRRKIGHSRTTVRFAARDLVGDIDVDVHLHPDPNGAEGYRLGRNAAVESPPDLPDLCRLRPDEGSSPRRLSRHTAGEGTAGAGRLARAFHFLRSIFAA